MTPQFIYFNEIGNNDGKLIALEENINIPFNIKRVYYIYNTLKGVRRGFHAHKTLEQVLVCVSGSCKVLIDDGNEKEIVTLDTCTKGLYIKSVIWREMFDFKEGTVLMVLASELYDENDYIRSYATFKQFIARGSK